MLVFLVIRCVVYKRAVDRLNAKVERGGFSKCIALLRRGLCELSVGERQGKVRRRYFPKPAGSETSAVFLFEQQHPTNFDQSNKEIPRLPHRSDYRSYSIAFRGVCTGF